MSQHYVQADGTTSEPSGDQTVILDADGATMTTLNETGGLVWSRLAEPADTAALAATLQDAHPDVDASTLRDDAEQFVSQLRGAGLIVASDAPG